MARILVIDDDGGIRFTIGEICRFGGWETMEAENGQVGVDLFKRHRPDLVMVDFHMPVKDGEETVREIRKVDPLVPILVLTVDERQEVADRFLDVGATDFALKPIKAPDLIARIRVNLQIGVLQSQRALPREEVFVTKGISTTTLALLEGVLKEQKEYLTIDEITSKVGLAYQTVHRYLMHLVDGGKVLTECDYGRVGRPRNRYKLR